MTCKGPPRLAASASIAAATRGGESTMGSEMNRHRALDSCLRMIFSESLFYLGRPIVCGAIVAPETSIALLHPPHIELHVAGFRARNHGRQSHAKRGQFGRPGCIFPCDRQIALVI